MHKIPKSHIITHSQAGIAQLVEHNLAKVGVASSSLVSRSRKASDISEAFLIYIHARRGARVVESGGLENRCASNRTVGSNPTLSAQSKSPRFMRGFLLCVQGGMRIHGVGSNNADRH